MRPFRTLAVLFAAVATLFSLGAVGARANVDVYSTPGGHLHNGRLWRTECEPYSSTVIRCRTEIWATTVTLTGGQYTRDTGWAFNNLTYLPSPASNWTGNPLARTGEWTATDGRQWRTECFTEATGRDACRSYAQARVARATAGPSGWIFSVETQWVFNNIVQFSSGSRPWIREVPDDVIERAKLTHTGFGPVQLGASMNDLARLGHVRWVTSEVCDYWEPSQALRDLGVSILVAGDTVDTVVVESEDVETSRGISVGDTFAEAETAYADLGYHHDLKSGYQPVYTYAADLGGNEMIFLGSFADTVFPADDDTIGSLIVRKNSTELMWDGC